MREITRDEYDEWSYGECSMRSAAASEGRRCAFRGGGEQIEGR